MRKFIFVTTVATSFVAAGIGISVFSQTSGGSGGWQCFDQTGTALYATCFSSLDACTASCVVSSGDAGGYRGTCGQTNCSTGASVTPTPTPSPTCWPRPSCLDTEPRCLLAEPVEGWCPAPSVTPTPAPGGFQCSSFWGTVASNTCYATKDVCEKECYSITMQNTTSPIAYGSLCAQTSCNPYVTVCTQEYAPVCGTDGRTYPNSCYAKAAGIPIAYSGECGACLDTICDPLPTGCQYVKMTTISGTYTNDYSYAGTTAYTAPTMVIDSCWCGSVVCPTPTPSAGGAPSPTPIQPPQPSPLPCSNSTGFTSSCWQDGSRIINVAMPTVAQSNVSFTVVIKMPTTASANAIWNRAHYYSNSQQRWVPIPMTGTKYPNYQFNPAGEGYVTGTAGTSVSVPLTDALNGKIYVVTWDYTYDGTAWKPPTSASCTNPIGCWRLEAVPTQ